MSSKWHRASRELRLRCRQCGRRAKRHHRADRTRFPAAQGEGPGGAGGAVGVILGSNQGPLTGQKNGQAGV